MLNEQMLQELRSRPPGTSPERVGEPRGDSLLRVWRRLQTGILVNSVDEGLHSVSNLEYWAEAFDQIRGLLNPETEDRAFDLLRRKHHDYGGGSLLECGGYGIVVRGFDKIYRLRNIARLRSNGSRPLVPETELDTLIDLFNYSVLGYLLSRGGITECAD